MNKLIYKMSVMVAMLAATAAFVVIVVPPDRGDYLAVINDKMEMIESAHGPKIVFVGGSNLAFGLDSARVEAETGYTVVNMGMGFNMGLRFMLDLVEPRIGADDVVVLVPEYNLFFGLFDGDERLLDVLGLYPEGFAYVRSPRQYYNLARNLPRHVKFKMNRYLATLGREPDPDCIYCPQAFNRYGDVERHLDRPGKDVASMDFLRRPTGVDHDAIREINAFAARIEAGGAKAFMLFPCIPQLHYERTRARIDQLYADLKAELKIPVLAEPAGYAFPIEYFYDWVYHLNRRGREVRTQRVLADLGPVIPSRYSQADK